MGYGDVSCLNESSKLNTVNIDRMAEEGIKFTDSHSSSALCTPTRYGILTGRYNWRSAMKSGVLNGYSPPLIEKGRLTVASMLKEKGYKTACVGKWHLGLDWGHKEGAAQTDNPADKVDFSKPVKNGPGAYGFDYFYGISASLDMPPYVYIENEAVTRLPDRETEDTSKMGWWRKGPTGADFRHDEVLPRLTEKAKEFIGQNSGSPFFLYFPLPAPHTPILPSKEFTGKSKTNSYGDFVLMCDDAVGQILDKLEREGVADNTIIMFASDNGCSPFSDFEELASFGHNPNYVFRGHKTHIYEGGHRIPLVIRWPEKIKPGSVSGEYVCLCDLMATMAEITGYDLPDSAGEDSVSNLPVWDGRERGAPLREAVVHSSGNGSFAIRKGKYKLEMCQGSGGGKQVHDENAPPIQLYDLDADISETTNIYDKYPEVVAELKALLTKYIIEGRSTPGTPQKNTGGERWEQIRWIDR